jgi:voltage-gated potassium channel
MSGKKYKQYHEFHIRNKYEILLISFIVLIFGDVFFQGDFDVSPLLIIQNVVASSVLFYGKKKWRWTFLAILALLIIIEAITLIFGFPYSRMVFAITYIIYFLFLSIEVFRQILTTKEVTSSTISAVLCGFIILALMGGYTFLIIEMYHSGSFKNLTAGSNGFTDLMYFSFVTIITIGYGDITPVTVVAKKAAMFFGLIGNFYSVVIIGIIIGKFISKSE